MESSGKPLRDWRNCQSCIYVSLQNSIYKASLCEPYTNKNDKQSHPTSILPRYRSFTQSVWFTASFFNQWLQKDGEKQQQSSVGAPALAKV